MPRSTIRITAYAMTCVPIHRARRLSRSESNASNAATIAAIPAAIATPRSSVPRRSTTVMPAANPAPISVCASDTIKGRPSAVRTLARYAGRGEGEGSKRMTVDDDCRVPRKPSPQPSPGVPGEGVCVWSRERERYRTRRFANASRTTIASATINVCAGIAGKRYAGFFTPEKEKNRTVSACQRIAIMRRFPRGDRIPRRPCTNVTTIPPIQSGVHGSGSWKLLAMYIHHGRTFSMFSPVTSPTDSYRQIVAALGTC